MVLTANIKWYINSEEWGVVEQQQDFYQEFVTAWHNAYLQYDQDEGAAMEALIDQVNWNVEYYYNNLSAWWHINESAYSQEQWFNGVVWESAWFTYDIISWQEIADADFDINTHAWIFYWYLTWWENLEFWPIWWE